MTKRRLKVMGCPPPMTEQVPLMSSSQASPSKSVSGKKNLAVTEYESLVLHFAEVKKEQ